MSSKTRNGSSTTNKRQRPPRRTPLQGDALVAAMVADTKLVQLAEQGFADFERGDYVRLEDLERGRNQV